MDQFKREKARQYTTTFDSEPSSRPSYVPSSYSDPVSRTYHYVYYDPGYRGYGYYDMWGSWVFYNAVENAAVAYADSQPVVVSTHAGAWAVMIAVIGLVAIVIVIAAFGGWRRH